MDKKCVLTTSDTPPKIEYIGLWNMLDELVNKVKESYDVSDIETYCELFEKLYRLLDKGE